MPGPLARTRSPQPTRHGIGQRRESRLFHIKLALVAAVGALLVWHTRRSDLHILEAIIFLLSLAIVWLGLNLANGYS
jgi:hypothetical protein